MDRFRFDSITTALHSAPNRRALLAALIAVALNGNVAEGKKKKGKKKKKKAAVAPPPPPPTSPPPPTCQAESQNATCSARCGTWPNNCGQDVTCPVCAAGKKCLINGSCGYACSGDTCAPGCGCSGPNSEGDRFCVAALAQCPTQQCSSTTTCPLGAVCHDTGLPGCPGRFVCWPLCPTQA